MVLEKDCMSAETLSVLRDKFSPSFGLDNESLRPIVTIFNKLKNNLPEETYHQVFGLLLQYDTSQTAEKPYHHILVENRILHILRGYEGLRFDLLDVLHNTTSHDDHILNAVQDNRDSKESMNDEGVKGGGIQTDSISQMPPCSSSDADAKTMQLRDDMEKHPSREFSLSRQLYQKIPTSLHDSNVEDSSASDEEMMRDITLSSELKNEVLDDQHLEAPTETLGANDGSDECGTSKTKMGFSKRGSCKRKVQSSDMSVDEGGGEIGKGEDSSEGRVVGESSSVGDCVSKGHKSEMGGTCRSKKRTRRLGAREDDMMLKKVGSHCIVIGVKEHAMTTDSSDYNTQSETDTMGSEPITSQYDDDDEEGVLVIAEEKQPSSKPKKQKRSRSGKSSAYLVKVSALCRGATILEKRETRNKKGKRLKEDAQQVVMKREFHIPRNQNENINNNSCSASEISDEDVTNTYLEITSGSESLSFSKMAPHASDDERTVLDILSSAESEDYKSEKQTSTVSIRQNYHFLKCHRKRPYPDSSTSITPFTNSLGLQPSGSDGNLSNPTQNDTNHLPKSDKITSRSYYNPAKSRPASFVASRSYSKSTRPKYNPNFPFSTSAFSAMSSIAEAASFEGSDYLLNQESSQDDILDYSEYDTASSQDGYLERERVYGLGTFAQDDADDISFLNRLLRSPSPPHCAENDGIWARKRRRRHKPKKDRKPRKPRRSRRLRGKRSQESDGDGDTKDNIPSQASKPASGRACTCCS